MWQCPVCGKQQNASRTVCDCGYDAGADQRNLPDPTPEAPEHYHPAPADAPTLQQLLAQLAKQEETIIELVGTVKDLKRQLAEHEQELDDLRTELTTLRLDQNQVYVRPMRTIADNTYNILCKANPDFALDVDLTDGNARIRDTFNQSTNQMFIFAYQGDGYYKITVAATGKVLDVLGGAASDGTNVHQYDWNGTDAQLWAVVPKRDGSFVLMSKLGFAMDVCGGAFRNDTNVQIWTPNGTSAQSWIITI